MNNADADERREREAQEKRESRRRRASAAALLAVVALIGYVLLFGGDEYEVTANFENASQLVEGGEVILAGASAGSIKTVELAPDNTALITFSVDDEFAPLPQGTTAQVNPYSLSSIANNQIDLTLPPDQAEREPIPDGGIMTRKDTIANVSIDELFNTLDDRTVRNLKKVIKGFEISYDGVGEQANRGFRYLNPFLSTSRRVFGELNRDERTLERLIVDSSKLSGALAQRAPQITAIVANLNRMMGALGAEKAALAESISRLPGFMRSSNTTFVNLRATLDDVDPLIDASKPVARKLQPFFREFRAAARNAVPTIRDLDEIVKRPGKANDLVELTALQPALAEAALGSGSPRCANNPTDPSELAKAADQDFTQGAFGESICSLRDGLPSLAHFRAYTPELVGWLDDFSGNSGTAADANGGQARIAPVFNTFSPGAVPGFPQLLPPPLGPGPEPPEKQIEQLSVGNRSRCPGANERPAADGSNPFTENGELNCDPTQLPPGP